MKKRLLIPNMGFFRRFFTKKNQDVETEVSFEESEEEILEVLKEKYVVDVDENVESIESILDEDEEEILPGNVQPAPDYDQSNAALEDVFVDEKMENFSEKNVVTHDSIEEMGDHLNTAEIIGDLPEEVSFD
ncbi:hypothetical protein OAV29_00940 [Candidatus Poseidoniaceae archaeon]|nr:hypothetical protein [Candidatus Poseidoniaceae archaeon]